MGHTIFIIHVAFPFSSYWLILFIADNNIKVVDYLFIHISFYLISYLWTG